MRLINDHFQNHKRHNVPPAQLIIADIPYNVGTDAYGSSPQWYIDGEIGNTGFDDTMAEFGQSENPYRVKEEA